MKKLCLFIAVVAALSACGGRATGVSRTDGGDTLALQYARLLTIVDGEGYSVVSVKNPWDTLKTLHTYVLAPADKPLPDSLPKGTLVRTPLKRTLMYTAVHTSLMEELGVAGSVAGVCDLQYINLPFVQEGVTAGRIANCGSAMAPDVERVMDLSPDAIFLSPFNNSGGYGKVEDLDIPIVECADYMETSALGEAEWVKFYGMLFGVRDEADALFRQTEERYRRLVEMARQSDTRLSVITEMKIGSVWYVPGGKSTQGQLLADANARYAYAADGHSGSLALSFEAVFDKAGQSDVWLFKYNRPTDLTYADLVADYHGNAEMKAFKTRNCYGCNTGRVPYYEETPFHPDRLLADLIQMLHPGIVIDGGLRYFSKIDE